MRVLLDTCVLSELYKPSPSESVKNAVASLAHTDIYISVITLGEINKGIHLLIQSQRKHDLIMWFSRIRQDYTHSILSIDNETALIWGEMTAQSQNKGHTVGTADGLIAATALRHGLHLMTRNVKDFITTGILIYNPWDI